MTRPSRNRSLRHDLRVEVSKVIEGGFGAGRDGVMLGLSDRVEGALTRRDSPMPGFPTYALINRTNAGH